MTRLGRNPSAAFCLLTHDIQHRVNEFGTLSSRVFFGYDVSRRLASREGRTGRLQCRRLSSRPQCSDLSQKSKRALPHAPSQNQATAPTTSSNARNRVPHPWPNCCQLLTRHMQPDESAWACWSALCSVLSVRRQNCRDGRADQKARLGRSPWFLSHVRLGSAD